LAFLSAYNLVMLSGDPFRNLVLLLWQPLPVSLGGWRDGDAETVLLLGVGEAELLPLVAEDDDAREDQDGRRVASVPPH
jgi:hypothetical protein